MDVVATPTQRCSNVVTTLHKNSRISNEKRKEKEKKALKIGAKSNWTLVVFWLYFGCKVVAVQRCYNVFGSLHFYVVTT